MARNFNMLTNGLSGKVGDLIFYERNGKPYSRRRPQYGPDSLSAASKQSGKEFGKASMAAKSIRAALHGLWQPIKEETTIFRLNKAVYAALREDTIHPRGKRVFSPAALHNHLKDFRYNIKAGLTIGGIASIRQEDGSILVKLPASWQNWLKAPKDAGYIQLQAAALDMDLDNNTCVKATTAASCIPLSDEEHSLLLSTTHIKATATIVLLQLRFLHTDKQLQANASTRSEQAFITAVLEPSLPPVKPQEKPSKSPRIVHKKPSAAEILKNAARPAPQTDRSPSAISIDNHCKATPLPVNKYKKRPTLVNVE